MYKLWKRRLLVLALLSVNAFGVSPFQKYGDEFEALAKQHGRFTRKYMIRFGAPIQEGNLSSTNIGFCEPNPAGHSVITIDQGFWERTNETCRRALIFHEAAHCGFGKGHTEKGIMRPQLDCNADVMELFK